MKPHLFSSHHRSLKPSATQGKELRERLFSMFAERFVPTFLKQSSWVLFSTSDLSPEVRRILVVLAGERAFAVDGHSLASIAQAFGALTLGKSVLFLTPCRLLREHYAALTERHLLESSLNFKWLALVDHADAVGLSTLRGTSFPLIRIHQESSAIAGLHLIFDQHGPGFLELPIPAGVLASSSSS